jgi:RNA recognition motif-containing protein
VAGVLDDEGDDANDEAEPEIEPGMDGDAKNWLWMLENMQTAGYGGAMWRGNMAPLDVPLAGFNDQWLSGPAACGDVDIMQLASAALHAAGGAPPRPEPPCNSPPLQTNVMQLAAAALEAANGKIIDPLEWNGVCTVMMRNLPNQVTQEVLTSEINNAGFLHAYDFIYLPIDPDTNANRGYAFINFTTAGLALMFKMHFEGRKLANFNSNKVVSVVPAALQGFDANYAQLTKKTAQEAATAKAKEAKAKKSQRGGRHKAESLIDIAARAQRGGSGSAQQQDLQDHVELEDAKFGAVAGEKKEKSSQGDDNSTTEPTTDAGKSPQNSSDEASQDASSNSHPRTPLRRAANSFVLGSPNVAKSPAQTQAKGPVSKPTIDESGKKIAKFCPFCGGSLKKDFKFCRFCGSDIAFTKAMKPN